MKGILLAHALLFAVATLPLSGQQPPKPQLPKGQMPDLGRPTKVDDELPPFNFDEYFPGKWTFEWDVPEGPLGPSGRITGTTIYKPVDGRFYEADTDATGPGGAFKLHELIAYHKENKALSRYVDRQPRLLVPADRHHRRRSRRLSTTSTSTARRSRYNGKTIRIKHAMRLLSPFNYKVGDHACRSTAARSGTTATPGGARTRRPRK